MSEPQWVKNVLRDTLRLFPGKTAPTIQTWDETWQFLFHKYMALLNGKAPDPEVASWMEAVNCMMERGSETSLSTLGTPHSVRAACAEPGKLNGKEKAPSAEDEESEDSEEWSKDGEEGSEVGEGSEDDDSEESKDDKERSGDDDRENEDDDDENEDNVESEDDVDDDEDEGNENPDNEGRRITQVHQPPRSVGHPQRGMKRSRANSAPAPPAADSVAMSKRRKILNDSKLKPKTASVSERSPAEIAAELTLARDAISRHRAQIHLASTQLSHLEILEKELCAEMDKHSRGY
ncbi:hypothetical protein BD779DRAFT_1477166 [Infundibulicybe gibba]|nr:hypothetical protein BD779DRAFT_1477166 [Infundibulicybe gibba]